MAIYEHITEFFGKPVRDYDSEKPTDPNICYRIRVDWDEETGWSDKFAAFLDDVNSREMDSLIIGMWSEEMFDVNSEEVVAALVAARERLPKLRAVFLGDVIMEETEISWMHQSDVSPLLKAYPDLEHFRVRGGNDLEFGNLKHAKLKTLSVESGGLASEVTAQIISAHLPELEHLEIWTGTDNYGGTTTLEDLQPILNGENFLKLKYLGLRDCEFADQLAHALASSPIIERIEVLDLSLGTLGDEGAVALLASPYLTRLKKLDLHHHYCSDGIMERLKQLPLEIDVSLQQQVDREDGEEYRYVAVSE
jgi:hypothetical protein